MLLKSLHLLCNNTSAEQFKIATFVSDISQCLFPIIACILTKVASKLLLDLMLFCSDRGIISVDCESLTGT